MSIPKAPIQVFLDSDGPIADFRKALDASGLSADVFKHLPGTYLWLEQTVGAAVVLDQLRALDNAGKIRVWILTKTPSGCPYAYTEKVLWYRKNFPWLESRVIISHDKSVIGSSVDYLLDDRPHKANADKFPGYFVFFDETKPVESWIRFREILFQDLCTISGKSSL